MRNAVRVEHLLEIAVVGADQHLAAGREDRVGQSAERDIDRFDRLDRRGFDAGVADHVRVRDVADDEIELSDAIASTSLSVTSGQLISGLQIVGRDVRARHEDALLAGNGASRPPEKKNVTCAYFSVSAMRSCVQAERREVFAERVLHRLRRIRDRGDGEAFLVLGQRDERRQARPARALEAGEIGIDERMRNLARAIGAEVHEDDRVAIDERRAAADDGRLDELVVLAARVGALQRVDARSSRAAMIRLRRSRRTRA